MTTRALSHAADNFDRFIADLHDYLRFPSISTIPESSDDVARCADWLVDHLLDIGITRAEAVKTAGHPIVLAELDVDKSAPTVLAYGHYDVQPPDPLELWKSPPFDPQVRDGRIYARGAVDDKGQSMMIFKAIESCLKSGDVPSVNIKLMLEGEEETGSPSFAPFLQEYRSRLSADVALVCDTGMPSEDVPALTGSLRGLTYLSIAIERDGTDLHSGHYGGGVTNVLHILADVIAGLHDRDGHITVPGFYDDVIPVDNDTRGEIAQQPFDERAYLAPTGLDRTSPEATYSVLESTTARPAIDVNGVWGGYSGRGGKTIIPARAGAKISARLVAAQDPADIEQKIKRHIEVQLPSGYTLTAERVGLAHPVSIDRKHPAMRVALDALTETCGHDAVIVRGGGSIPAVALMREHLGIDSVMVGFGLESDSVHAPNECFGLDRYRRGIDTLIRFFLTYAKKANA